MLSMFQVTYQVWRIEASATFNSCYKKQATCLLQKLWKGPTQSTLSVFKRKHAVLHSQRDGNSLFPRLLVFLSAFLSSCFYCLCVTYVEILWISIQVSNYQNDDWVTSYFPTWGRKSFSDYDNVTWTQHSLQAIQVSQWERGAATLTTLYII